MNSVFISGRLTNDPETFAPNSGEYTYLKFDVANDDEYNGKEKITSFFTCKYRTKYPKKWINHLHKGKQVWIAGHLKQETWEKEGKLFSRIIVKVSKFPEIAFSGKKKEEPDQEDNLPF